MGRPRLHLGGRRRLHRARTPAGRFFTGPFSQRPDQLRAEFNGRLVDHQHCRAADRVLLILLVVELLYTVQVSFREHALMPEPFLLIGLIAGIRRVLLLTAELAQVQEKSDVVFQHFIAELLVLTILIVALVISLVLLRKKNGAVAERAK